MPQAKILIVVDESSVARDLQDRLTALGHNVSGIARSGEEAIALADRERPDLALVDMGLRGELDGIETAYQLRSRFGAQIVFVIDSADDRLLDRSQMLWPSSYLTKPYQDGDIRIALKIGLDLGQADTKKDPAGPTLTESEERYRNILDSIEDGYYEVDLAGNFIFTSDSLCRLYGYTRDEFVGVNYRDYTDENALEFVFEAYNRVYTTGQPVKGIGWEIVRRDGSRGYTEASISLIKDSAGQGIGFRGIVRDMTERWLAEKALKESEERYRGILGNIEDAYYEVDLAGNLTFFNDSLCRLYGYSRQELMGMNYRVYVPEDYVAEVYRAFNRVYATGEPSKGSGWEYVTKDGTRRYGEASVTLIKDVGGRGVGFQGIVRDVTERRRAEEALRESEERYRLLAEEARDVIWSVDLKTMRLTHVSPSVERILGLTVNQAMKLDFEELFGPEPYQLVVEALAEEAVVEAGGLPDRHPRRVIEFKLDRPDGQTVWMEATIAFFRDDDSQPLGLVGVARDITNRKLAEEEREKLIFELQHTLAEVKTLSGLLPICANCKKVRGDQGYWQQIESYISEHSETQFSHGICPDCLKKLYPEQYEKMIAENPERFEKN
ncbi:MAG: PAS domain S-box protein [Proteobacteria bacterium]|nr:PAS domain S-box protein [Pseudomonadota bacterium]MBU1741525.1 PAS domain S-box protein [Pseudomonadota bacterium]